MYKINRLTNIYVSVIYNNKWHYHYYLVGERIMKDEDMTKEYLEYALGAEEFAKKWLEHNKEWL